MINIKGNIYTDAFFNRFDKKTEISQQECFQLLTRATQVFREEYLQKQEHAQQEIQKR